MAAERHRSGGLRSSVLHDAGQGRSTSSLGRRPALDGLRGVAIALVVWLHSMAAIVPPSGWHLLGGGLGVDIFFVLSGFLITTLLLEGSDEGPGRLRRFYTRRAARLLPALLAFLLVHTVVSVVLGWGLRRQVVTLAGALTFTSNWVPTFGGDVAIATLPLWSLAVEEQFYLLWPAALGLLGRFAPRHARGIVVAAIGLVAGWRVILTVAYGAGYPIVYQRTDARLDSILIGAGLAMLLQTGWNPSRRAVNTMGVMGAVVVSFWVVNPTPRADALFFGGFTLVALGTAAVILALVRGGDTRAHRLLCWRPLVALGRISYSLYLWHYLVFVLVHQVVDAGPYVRLAVAYCVALACATASYRGIEQPVLRWASSARQPRPVAATMSSPAPRSLRSAGAIATATFAVLLGTGVGLASAARQASPDDDAGEVAQEPTTSVVPGEQPAAADPPVPAGDGGVEDPGLGTATTTVPASKPGAEPTAPTPPAVELVDTQLVVSAPAVSGAVPGEPPSLRLTARLTTAGGEPLDGRSIRFDLLEAPACAAVTDAQGVASCAVAPPPAPSADLVVVASFPGDGTARPSTARWAASAVGGAVVDTAR